MSKKLEAHVIVKETDAGYKIVKLYNTIEFSVGKCISKEQVQALIDAGEKVTVQ